MPRSVFNKIQDAVIGQGTFIQRYDALNNPGIHPLVHLTAVLRIIAYGNAYDSVDEYLRLSEMMAGDSLKEFSKLVVCIFGNQYLNRTPTPEEKSRIAHGIYKKRGFPGCFGDWDCKHFIWKNCPV